LKTSGGSEREAGHLADDAGESAMPKTLFHGREDFGLAAGLGVDDAIGVKADRGECRGEEVTALQAPQHRAFQAGEDPGRKEGGTGAMLARRAGFHELVNGPESEPIAGQVLVDGRDSEGQHGALPATALKPLNALAKLRQNDIAPGIAHALPQGSRLCSVPILFSLSR
jgi:hypothetical protein